MDWNSIYKEILFLNWRTIFIEKNPQEIIQLLIDLFYLVTVKYVPVKRSTDLSSRKSHISRKAKNLHHQNVNFSKIKLIEKRLAAGYEFNFRHREAKAVSAIK